MANPRVLKKAQLEIRHSMAGQVHEVALSNLGYLKAIIKETLRLHPSAALVPRVCLNNCKIQGYDMPQGTICRDHLTPFGTGRRICPGINFANANMEIALASLLYHFDWKLPVGLKPEKLDMTEVFGVTIRRKAELLLHPIPMFHM
ncbi:hypothetical protein SETIT_9G266200v2 [Setaria italica]|nr:hypothetical protein SETIT_9G266200v2 [Setaria italica]